MRLDPLRWDRWRAIPAIVAVFQRDTRSRGWAGDAIRALATIEGGAGPGVVALLNGPDRNTATAAARVLGHVGGPDAIRALTEALRSPDPAVTVAALEALSRIGPDVPVQPLVETLRHADGEVRATALRTLFRADPGAARRHVPESLSDPDHRVVIAAIRALGKHDDPQAVKAVMRTTFHRDERVRTVAVGALAAVAPDDARPRLAELLDDGAARVRRAAADLIGRIGTPGMVALLLDAFPKERDQQTRISIVGALKALLKRYPHEFAAVELTYASAATMRDALAEFSAVLGDGRTLGAAVALASIGPSAEPVDAKITAFHPAMLQVGRWQSLLLYVHLPSAAATVAEDAGYLLRGLDGHERAWTDALSRLVPGSELIVRPFIPSCRVNPPEATVAWEEDWHRVEFRICPDSAKVAFVPGAPVHGVVSVMSHTLLIGEVVISARIAPEAGPDRTRQVVEKTSTGMFQSIFPSYSRRDTEVVSDLARAYRALGVDFLRDIEALRSGDEWQTGIGKLIDRSDVFQLFWSQAARNSRNVEREWRQALRRPVPRFIRPVYWQTPMPDPPAELSDRHFAYLELSRSAQP